MVVPYSAELQFSRGSLENIFLVPHGITRTLINSSILIIIDHFYFLSHAGTFSTYVYVLFLPKDRSLPHIPPRPLSFPNEPSQQQQQQRQRPSSIAQETASLSLFSLNRRKTFELCSFHSTKYNSVKTMSRSFSLFIEKNSISLYVRSCAIGKGQ